MSDRVHDNYIKIIALVEQLHRQFLELVRLELDGLGVRDINNVQGLLLFNISDTQMTVGDLVLRGYYLGSNVSYNIKKMVKNGYLTQLRSIHDRRVIYVRPTEKGTKLREKLRQMHQRQVEMLHQSAITHEDLQALTATLGRLERFWVRVPQMDSGANRSETLLGRS